ncbi:MAG: hypothetical protein ACI4ON_00425 [Clostridia bacterium]
MKDFTEKDMSDLIYEKLAELGQEVVLNTPTTESIYPCRVIQTPLVSIKNKENTNPVYKRFQITIENWTDTQRGCMDMINKTDEKLKELNILRINSNSIILFDEITKKYRMIGTYEVNYNALYDAFFCIKI